MRKYPLQTAVLTRGSQRTAESRRIGLDSFPEPQIILGKRASHPETRFDKRQSSQFVAIWGIQTFAQFAIYFLTSPKNTCF
jgi:hypothetical protein